MTVGTLILATCLQPIDRTGVFYYKSCRVLLVRLAMSPKRGWRDFFAQIELGVETANLGVE